MVHPGLRASGRPLDPATRAFMERRFAHDFGAVRLHTGAAAAESARAVDAAAYTVGNQVVLGQERPTVYTLAHELAHVVQQQRGGPVPPPLQGGPLEHAADAAASAVVAGRSPVHVAGASAPGLARQPRSLAVSLYAKNLSDSALEREIAELQQWLAIHPGDSHLASELERLEAEAWRRQQRALKKERRQQQILAVVEAVEAGRIPKWLPVFAFRPSRGIFRMDVAPIMARREGGKIYASQPVTGVKHTDRFKKDARTLPYAVWTDEGAEFDPKELVGVRLYDEDEKVVVIFAEQLLELAAASDRAVFVNIALTAASVVAGPAVGRLAGGVASRAATFTSQRVLQPGLTSLTLGTAEAAPTAFASVASRSTIQLVETRAVGAVAQQAVTRQAAVQALEQATVQTATQTARIGAPLITPAVPAVAGVAGTGIAGTSIAGSTQVQVSPADYAARLGFVYPQQAADPVLAAVEAAGQRAAAVLADASTQAGARFIQACRSRNFTLAGTLFHAEAARQLAQLAAGAIPGVRVMVPEDTVQAGAGGSRLDVTAVDTAGNHYSIDWKTTGRSAFSSKARSQMHKHATQYLANRAAPLEVQISKSWVDFVRALIPNVRWPK
jgi:hypothetical protein